MASQTGMFRTRTHPRYLRIAVGLFIVGAALTGGISRAQAVALTAHMVPTGGTSTTSATPQSITPGNIAAIDSIDDPADSYATYTWPSTLTDYNENKYVEYTFDSPNIPSDATIDSVTLTHVYYYPNTAITAAKLEVWDGTAFTNVPLTLPSAQGKIATVTDTKDLTSLLSTPNKVNAAKVRMLAYGNGQAPIRTSEDELVIDVAYHTTPPSAGDVTSSTSVDAPVTITLAGTDAGSAPLTYAIVQAPADGTLGAISNGQVVYTPTGTTGTDTFTYTANNGTDDSAPATVTVSLTPGALSSLTLSASTNAATTGTQVSFTATAHDSFGNVLTNDSATDITLSGPGSDIVTPTDPLASGVASFTATASTAGSVDFTATAGSVASSVATVVFSDPVPLSDPSATPQPGEYSSAQQVSLSSASAGASIRYTTDGTVPDCDTSGTLYQNPIEVDSSENIQALSCGGLGSLPSSVVTLGYTIDIPAIGIRRGGGGIVPAATPVMPSPAPAAPVSEPAAAPAAPVPSAPASSSSDTAQPSASSNSSADPSPAPAESDASIPPSPLPGGSDSAPVSKTVNPSAVAAAAAYSGFSGDEKTLGVGALALFLVGMIYLIWRAPAQK